MEYRWSGPGLSAHEDPLGSAVRHVELTPGEYTFALAVSNGSETDQDVVRVTIAETRGWPWRVTVLVLVVIAGIFLLARRMVSATMP